MRAWPSAGLPDTRSAPRRVRGKEEVHRPRAISRGGDTAPKWVQLVGGGVDAWPRGKRSDLDPESSGSPGRLRPTAKSNQSEANSRPLPATPRRTVLCPSVPARRSPAP